MSASASLSDKADAIEHQKIRELDALVLPSALFTMVDGMHHDGAGARLAAANPGKYMLMGDDPRLPKMPAKPALVDFFKLRFGGAQHLLQSAHHALKAGYDEKVVIACLLHDIAVVGLIRGDHGYWGAQLVEPYVEPEVSWAIRAHQALRFYPDESVGYAYPEIYKRFFGPDYRPDAYIEEEYQRARGHKWYMTARLICVSDIYSFDPNKRIQIEEFTDVIGRNFRQPKEGLGYDASPVAHMWRTMIRPTKFL